MRPIVARLNAVVNEALRHCYNVISTFRKRRLIALHIFKKHIGGEAADFRPKARSCAFSCNHPRPNMADQNCNLGNDPSSKPLSLMCYKSITA